MRLYRPAARSAPRLVTSAGASCAGVSFLAKITIVDKKTSLVKRTGPPRALIDAVTAKGWRTHGLVLRSKRSAYHCVVERSEARAERLEAALALALLKATTHRRQKEQPLAVVSVPKLSPRMQAHLEQFVIAHGGKISWGIIDDSGRVILNTPELVVDLPGRTLAQSIAAQKQIDLFTDLNQWLLKVLLTERFPRDLLEGRAPGRFRNASVLAGAAGVSLPVVSRLLAQLDSEGFLETRNGHLEVVRLADLLDRWRMAQLRSTRAEIPVRLQVVGSSMSGWMQECRPNLGPETRVCAGLFDAAARLGLKHVVNAPHIVWLDNGGGPVDQAFLRDLGLIVVESGAPCDFTIRIPRFPQAIFRASVAKEDEEIPGWVERFTDVIQTWMDVSHHPARGRELADRIWSDLLVPCIGDS